MQNVLLKLVQYQKFEQYDISQEYRILGIDIGRWHWRL